MIFFKGNKGFSILELMMVVIIIGILAPVAVQKWREYQAKTGGNIRRMHLQVLNKVIQVYYLKHNIYPKTNGQWSWEVKPDLFLWLDTRFSTKLY